MEKQQFDELLGGNHRLPKEAFILNFLTARSSEIAQITHELENPQQTKRIFQKLPAHMRRRVMSHNAKRLPRNLREIHIKQMAKAGLPCKTKRSRKHRRRPRNLLNEYNRRKRDKFWMETHIWHAKRFKIVDKYGFKIPFHSNDRCFKANYRAIRNHCLLQDISYYTCIELKGKRSVLLETLANHCSDQSLTFAAKIFANGEREGSLMFYKNKSYPDNPIGNVYFLWNPINEVSSINSTNKDFCERSIWIWIHPAFYNEIIHELIQSFQFKFQSNGNKKNEELEYKLHKKIWSDIKTMPPMFELLKSVKIPVYYNENNCQMTIMKNQLNRFRLRGPLALDIITDALRCPELQCKNGELIPINGEKNENANNNSWFEEYYNNNCNAQAFEVQKRTIESFNNLVPGQLPPYMVLGLSVLDPRFYLPFKRQKICSNFRQEQNLFQPPLMGNNSPLWSNDLRNAVIEHFIKPAEIDKLRGKKLVPGVHHDNSFYEDMRKIPILLVQKVGITGRSVTSTKPNGFASGIDIILPAAWAMPFWLALTLRCAKPAGLREALMTCFESENINSPDYFDPDTEIYKKEAILIKKELTERYFRRPPNRRVNFIKFKIAEPFFCNWSLLMMEYTGKSKYMVYRDYKTLTMLQEYHKGKNIKIALLENEKFFDDYLIAVKLTLINGGTPNNFAMICLPNQLDIQIYNKNKKWTGFYQKQVTDPFEKGRINLRHKHRLLLKRLKRKRIRICKEIKKMYTNPLIVQKQMRSIRSKFTEIAKKHIEQQAKTITNMYMPKSKSIRFESDRETFGFITQGGFCYTNAIGIGIGYVVAKVLIDIIKKKQKYVLVRNTSSKYFRLAKIEIVN